MKLTQNFILQEFVPGFMYEEYGESARWFLDQRLVFGMQKLREWLQSSVTVNTWHNGGDLNYRGYRPPDCEVGAYFSQHKRGNAVDFNVRGMTSDEVFDWCLKYEGSLLGIGFTTIENKEIATSWTHLDMRWTGLDKLLIVE